MNTAQLVGDTVTQWLKVAKRRPTVVFAVNVTHSVHIRDEFRRAGVLAEHIDGSTPVDERDAILKQLAAGSIEIATNCQVLTEGCDCPSVSCMVLAKPTKSLGLYRQMAGRTLRPAPGKTDALILDHAGAVFQHGFIDDPIAWAFDEDKRAEKTVQTARNASEMQALTDCPESHAVRMAGEPCPSCGWRPVAKPRAVEFVDGDLGQIDRDRRVHVSIQDQLAFYRELCWLLREKRYRNPAIKDGWIAAKHREKFDDWPPFSWRSLAPLEPSPATRAWVRSRDIAFAKAMAAKAGT